MTLEAVAYWIECRHDVLEARTTGEGAPLGDATRAMKSDIDVRARYRAAEELVHQGERLEEATDECIWLWEHMLEQAPEMRGVRRSFFLVFLSQLVDKYPQARKRFAMLRDALDAQVRRVDVPRDLLSDWLALNKVLQQEEVTLRWFDALIVEPQWLPLLQPQRIVLFPLLLSQGRWREAGLLLVNPVEELTRLLDILMQAPSPAVDRAEVAAAQRLVVQKTAAEMCGALAAASRMDEALRVQEEAQLRDGSDEMKQAIAQARKAAEEHRPVEQLF